jgi:hypothetical protein
MTHNSTVDVMPWTPASFLMAIDAMPERTKQGKFTDAAQDTTPKEIGRARRTAQNVI